MAVYLSPCESISREREITLLTIGRTSVFRSEYIFSFFSTFFRICGLNGSILFIDVIVEHSLKSEPEVGNLDSLKILNY